MGLDQILKDLQIGNSLGGGGELFLAAGVSRLKDAFAHGFFGDKEAIEPGVDDLDFMNGEGRQRAAVVKEFAVTTVALFGIFFVIGDEATA